ncbi:Kynurenine formamidase [Methylacidiphilum kamchatkense Kam1]|uniref:Kynurenine formamidase n=1 Tax=Methylacidiphilum kamchatkense Kam1 TaxID=1202785 RepID=A0A0C1UPY1_9BACT|nr:cyclase family protein [Methylacidiphilum kamchatkense]KIE57888.1 Kynurenine formamidase [Methylacidiphilum kamchatkense Kam1]QDQ41386.1 kynurenine formamidase [Methylacidiphilum kamchatkense Kam1]
MRYLLPTACHFHTIVDLTHPLHSNFPIFPGQGSPGHICFQTTKEDGYASNRWEIPEHWGTHFDAPLHYSKSGKSVGDIELPDLFSPLVLINISENTTHNPDTLLTLEDIRLWEERYGGIPENSVVLMYSGWEKWIQTPFFCNKKEDGLLHFPGFSLEAVQFLIHERKIAGIGVDTLSIDCGKSQDYPVHKTLLAAGKWGLECLCNLKELPPAGAWILVATIPLKGATGFPVRVLGFIP